MCDVEAPTLDNRHTDGGEIVSLVLLPRFALQKDFWYSFVLVRIDPRDIARLERLWKSKKKKCNDLISILDCIVC